MRRSMRISAGPPGHQHPSSSMSAPSASRSPTIAALVHHEHAVGQSKDLVEILRDHEHRDTAAAAARSSSCTFSMAPTSSPRVGEATTSALGAPANSRPITTFWRLPPGEVARACLGPGCAHRVRAISSLARRTIRLRRRNGPALMSVVAMALSTVLLAIERLGATPVPSLSSGTCATPRAIASRGSPARSSTPGDGDLARRQPRACPSAPRRARAARCPPRPQRPRSRRRAPRARRRSARATRGHPPRAGRSASSTTFVTASCAPAGGPSRPLGRPSARRGPRGVALAVATVATTRPPRSTVMRSEPPAPRAACAR